MCNVFSSLEKRQTMLFSATTTKKTDDLVAVALKKEPLYVGLEDRSTGGAATVQGLEQVWTLNQFNVLENNIRKVLF